MWIKLATVLIVAASVLAPTYNKKVNTKDIPVDKIYPNATLTRQSKKANSDRSTPITKKSKVNSTADLPTIVPKRSARTIPKVSRWTKFKRIFTPSVITEKPTARPGTIVPKPSPPKTPDTTKPAPTEPPVVVPPKPNPIPTDSSHSFNQLEMLTLINGERAKAGVAPLTLDDKASNAANLKSKDMADNNYFAHQSPTLGNAGNLLQSRGVQYSAWGENIAKGQPTISRVMEGWMNSPGHRANILSSKFTHVGLGAAKDSHGAIYWTQIFYR